MLIDKKADSQADRALSGESGAGQMPDPSRAREAQMLVWKASGKKKKGR